MTWFFKFDWSKLIREIERRQMSKKSKVQWIVGDGIKPSQRESDGCFEIKSPVSLTINPGVERKIYLGLRCSHALHFIPAWETKARGLQLVDGIWAAQDANPHQELQLTICNDSASPVLVDIGDLLARCAVLSNQNLEPEYI
jgi:hypothetical protein